MKEREAADKAIEFQDSVHKFRLIHERCLYLMNSEESSKLKKKQLMFRVENDLLSHKIL